MIKHKLTYDEADRLDLRVNTVVKLLPIKSDKGKLYDVYYNYECIARGFSLSRKGVA